MTLEKFGAKLENIIRKMKHLPIIDKKAVNESIKGLQRSLLSSDVDVELVLKTTENIKKKAMDTKLQRGKRKNFIIKLFYDELITLLGGEDVPKRIKMKKQNIILFVGIQGSGKTTTIGKLANYYKNKGFKVAVITTDNYRPAAYEQLTQLTKKINVKCYGNPNEKNTVKLALKETKKAINNGYNIILVDTAGRHKEEKGLMREISQIENTIKPNEIILVIDGSLGQTAKLQASEFAKNTKIGGIIITKLDGTSNGGGALSACVATNQPIRFIGTGENIEDLEEFNPESFISSLLRNPNMKDLINSVQAMQEKIKPESQERMKKGNMTLADLYEMLESLNDKVLKKTLKEFGMIEVKANDKEEWRRKSLGVWNGTINAMTPEERKNPKIIKTQRKKRISRGSGQSLTEINKILKIQNQLNKTIKQNIKNLQRGKKRGYLQDVYKNIPKGVKI